MNTNNRFCTYIGHDQQAATHLCISNECKQQWRWCCILCITSEVHKHNQQGFFHLMPWKDVMVQLKEMLLKLQQDHQNGLQQCIELLKLFKEYQSLIEQQIDKIQKTKQDLQHFIYDLSEQNFIKLSHYRLDEVIFINKSQFFKHQELQINSYQGIDQKLKSITKEIQAQRMAFHQTTTDLNWLPYEIKIIDKAQYDGSASQISNNQKYLAYSRGDDLKIYDIQKDNIIREIELPKYIYVIQFTYDSSQLYVGCNDGYVFGFNVLNDFNQIFELKIHKDDVLNIRTIQNKYLITCSMDTTIIKTDITSKQQLFQLIGHQECIDAIDYNEIDDILINGSSDQSIKLWDCKKKRILINKEESHKYIVSQIQLIDDFQNVLSLDYEGNLYKWKIDLNQKHLIKIQEFQDPKRIFNFYQINQNQNLILICGEYIKILNDQAETINQIDHQCQIFNQGECKQVDDGKLIQIISGDAIKLAIAHD